MYRCKKDFWINEPKELLCSTDVVPSKFMTFEERLNSLSRLAILCVVPLYLFDVKYTCQMFLVSILIIIIIYLIKEYQMNKMNTNKVVEKFDMSDCSTGEQQLDTSPFNMTVNQIPRGKQTLVMPKTLNPNIPSYKQVKINLTQERPSNYRFWNDDVSLDTNVFNNPNYTSINQKLAGSPNPKTNLAPVVIPPACDYTYWKANNMVVPSFINSESNIDLYQSGYQVSTCCGQQKTNKKNEYSIPLNKQDLIQSQFNRNQNVYESNIKENYSNTDGPAYNYSYSNAMPSNAMPLESSNYLQNKNRKTNIDLNTVMNEKQNRIKIRPNYDGQVNTSCGYDPSQLLDADLPSNFTSGNCQKQPIYKDFNKNLFTQTIQPGIYVRNEINEPINSNIGISFQQQFEPTTQSIDKDGNVMFVEHDPRLMSEDIIEPDYDLINSANNSNVYDPRYTGYGTSYRTYIDEQLGQPRFYYDDINAVRMPNYIVRSNIDNFSFMDSYGTMKSENGNIDHSKIRELANDAWLQSNLDQRTSLQQSLMRKRNIDGWQRRYAPINTMSSKSTSMSRI